VNASVPGRSAPGQLQDRKAFSTMIHTLGSESSAQRTVTQGRRWKHGEARYLASPWLPGITARLIYRAARVYCIKQGS